MFETVEIRIEAAWRALLQTLERDELTDEAGGIFVIRDRGRNLDAIAGGEQDGFGRAALLQSAKGIGYGLLRNSELLPELYRRGFVADTGDEELHCTRRLSR